MSHGDPGQRSIGGQLARGAVLVFSGTIAALLVLHSGPGCDGPKTDPAPKAAGQPTAAPAPAQAAAQAEPAPAAPAPVPAGSKEPAVGDGGAPALDPGTNAGNVGNAGDAGDADPLSNPRYFPASKSGVFIEPAPPANPPPQPPSQQAAQQAGTR